MCNAIKITRKELFEKSQVVKLEKNGILVRNSLIRPFARESTKKLIILELFQEQLSENKYKKRG